MNLCTKEYAMMTILTLNPLRSIEILLTDNNWFPPFTRSALLIYVRNRLTKESRAILW